MTECVSVDVRQTIFLRELFEVMYDEKNRPLYNKNIIAKWSVKKMKNE